MKRYLDIEHDKIYTVEELQKQYEELKANGETEEETFSQYLFNSKTENDGVLEEIERAFRNVETERSALIPIERSRLYPSRLVIKRLFIRFFFIIWPPDFYSSKEEAPVITGYLTRSVRCHPGEGYLTRSVRCHPGEGLNVTGVPWNLLYADNKLKSDGDGLDSLDANWYQIDE